MRFPRKLYLLIALVLLGVVVGSAGARSSANIEPQLLDTIAREGTANFFVKMGVEADLSAAYSIADWSARGVYVYETLKKTAFETQKPVVEYAQKHGLEYKSFFTTNAVYIRGGNLDAVRRLAALPGVAFVRMERIIALPDPIFDQTPVGPESLPQGTTDWGITDTQADQVWAMYGVRGAGIKVANIDTGVQWDHPALVNQFACPGDPTDPACWEDPSNICGAGGACDNYGHGTHTMGTMVASDDASQPYIAGMAPDATWIACKGCESYYCSEAALNGCADWVVAPDGNPDNRPDVVNNSWGGGGGDAWYLPKVNAWRAAGIFPAFSAGNNYSCSSLGSPGDYQESFGSASHKNGRTISSFSSKGPSVFGHDPYTKPNISAPGENICSTVPTNQWNCTYSGTSMASPHSAGAVALLWSGCPAYRGQIDLTFQILQNTTDVAPAGTCGEPPDGEGNYTYGYGFLNALSVIQDCIGGAELGTLEGHVYDDVGNPLEGATVIATKTLDSGQIQAVTDPNGFYTMSLMAGTYDVTASKDHYATVTVTGVVIEADLTTVQDFNLDPLPPSLHVDDILLRNRTAGSRYILKAVVTVKDWDGNPAGSALVTVDLTVPPDYTRSLSRETNASGKSGFTGRSRMGGTWTVCVTNIEKDGWVYDPSQNVVTCASRDYP